MRYLYHATNFDNLGSILLNGIKHSIEGYVYLTEKPEQAASFLAIRGIQRILVVQVKIYKKDENKIIETFDHNYNFFKFKCFGYTGDIGADKLSAYFDYQL